MKRSVVVGILAAAVFCFLLAVSTHVYATEKVITIKVANWFPITTKQSILLDEWCKELEKKTAGKVKVNYYPGGTLVPAAQSYDAVTKGISDVGSHVLGYTPGRFPLTEVIACSRLSEQHGAHLPGKCILRQVQAEGIRAGEGPLVSFAGPGDDPYEVRAHHEAGRPEGAQDEDIRLQRKIDGVVGRCACRNANARHMPC